MVICAYKQLVSKAITYYYAFTVEGMHDIRPLPRVRITQSYDSGIPAQVECGWGKFKEGESIAQDAREETKESFGEITKKIPGPEDYARVNAWKLKILDTCGVPQYKDYNFYIV